uniref:Diacylglycerol kinase n=1 Tax=Oncorhynchus tshawytscha TaxID=74940 RepID=A0A8C8HUF5_ONCTS
DTELLKIITPCRRLILCADNRKEMEDWMSAQKSVQNREHFEVRARSEHGPLLWYACSHARPTYCNVCREALSGVKSNRFDLSCLCKFKAHKRCAVRATNTCKLGLGEGNAKCTVCEETCGSVLRLQDWRCLWCRAMVHTLCKEQLSTKCPLGLCKVSVIPPTALNSIDSDGQLCSSLPLRGQVSPRYRSNLNHYWGKCHFTIQWIMITFVLQCQLGVLPLGTGNDLARVLGWGSACDDDAQLPQILEKLERASTKVLDRWSIMGYETKFPRQHSSSTVTEDCSDDSDDLSITSFFSSLVQQILTYEDSVAAHLSMILTSDQHSVVISSAKVLCETVKDFVARVGKGYEKNKESSEESEAMAKKCGVLKEKLGSLLKTLNEEAQVSTMMPAPPPTIAEEQEEGEGVLVPSHANSLKKAIRQIIEHTEKAVDEQNAQTQEGFALGAEEEEEDVSCLSVSLFDSVVSKTPCEKLINKGSLSLGSSTSLPAQTGNRESMPMLNTKILYLSVAGISGSFSSSSVISRLLVKSNQIKSNQIKFYFDCYTEKCVMNNYFGIGLDAKISLDFNNKRDEHPEKCRSRTKNMMWYGVLGTKELLHRTYKNLEQKVLLECDGRPIPLPSLQGIAVLNIPSYAGGTNFWGGTKEDDVMEFGCRTVKITILGDEGVPVQVDGEAWVQPPGYIKIIHKNRTQTLTRDRAFESTLKSWEDKQRCEFPRPLTQYALQPEVVSEEEASQINLFGQAAGALIHSIREIAQSHHSMEQELAHAVNTSSKAMDVVYANSKTKWYSRCAFAMGIVNSLWLSTPHFRTLLSECARVHLTLELRLRAVAGLWRLSVVSVRGVGGLKGVLLSAVHQWGTEEVAAWLELICLTEYKEIFIGHDVRGAELLHLERRDLKVLHTHIHTCRLSQISLLPPKVCTCLLPCTHLKGNSGIRNSH